MYSVSAEKDTMLKPVRYDLSISVGTLQSGVQQAASKKISIKYIEGYEEFGEYVQVLFQKGKLCARDRDSKFE